MQRRVIRFFRLYFGFSRRESRGFLLVFPGLVVLFFIPSLLGQFFFNAEVERYEQYRMEALAIAERIQPMPDSLGSLPIAKTVSVNPIHVPQDTAERHRSQWRRPDKPELNRVPFHEADSILLQAVVGVGPVISSRIVKYRDLLGGFYDAGQLLEVYGVTEELATKIYELFPFSPNIYKKLSINQLSSKDLAQHPYIGLNEARVIFAYRNQNGQIAGREDLLKIKILNEAWVDRIAPYLVF
jgi:competence protein ComEA